MNNTQCCMPFFVCCVQGQVHAGADVAGREHGCEGALGVRTCELFFQAEQVVDALHDDDNPHNAVYGRCLNQGGGFG